MMNNEELKEKIYVELEKIKNIEALELILELIKRLPPD